MKAGLFDQVTVVTGLPRSGTSLMMQMLVAGGIEALTDNVRTPDASNPRGYFEYAPVKRIAEDPGQVLELARGRAVKIIHWLLPHLVLDEKTPCRILFLRRPMREVIASQRTMLAHLNKPGAALDDARLAEVFQAQLARTEAWLSANAPNVQVCEVAHRSLLHNPGGEAARINQFMGGQLDVNAMAAVVDPQLWRERAGAG